MDSLVSSPVRHLRLPAVLELTGLSRPTLYRRIQQARFPAPVKDGMISVWPETAIAEYQRQLRAA
jgi:prophage regulatory protein